MRRIQRPRIHENARHYIRSSMLGTLREAVWKSIKSSVETGHLKQERGGDMAGSGSTKQKNVGKGGIQLR